MTYEAGFCVFVFVAFCAVMVYALYRRALNVDDAVRDDVESLPPQHINFRCTLQPIVNIKNTSDELLSRDDVLELAKPSSDWIDWYGGKCPVPEGTPVDVRHRDGDTGFKKPAGRYGDPCTGRASARRWSHKGNGSDIIAYRVCGQSSLDHKHIGAVSSGDTCAPVPERVQSVSNTSVPLPKGWQPWEGGFNPFWYLYKSEHQSVVVMRRSGKITPPMVASDLIWFHNGTDADILAYRIAD